MYCLLLEQWNCKSHRQKTVCQWWEGNDRAWATGPRLPNCPWCQVCLITKVCTVLLCHMHSRFCYTVGAMEVGMSQLCTCFPGTSTMRIMCCGKREQLATLLCQRADSGWQQRCRWLFICGEILSLVVCSYCGVFHFCDQSFLNFIQVTMGYNPDVQGNLDMHTNTP